MIFVVKKIVNTKVAKGGHKEHKGKAIGKKLLANYLLQVSGFLNFRI